MKLKVLVAAGDGIGRRSRAKRCVFWVSVAEFGGYDFQFNRDADRRASPFARPARTLTTSHARRLRSRATPCCWAPWGATNGIRWLPIAGPKQGLLQLANRWEGLPTSALPLPTRLYRLTRHCALK